MNPSPTAEVLASASATPGADTAPEVARSGNPPGHPNVEPFKASMRTPVPAMASELQELLGQALVAYTTGTRSSQPVGRWASGRVAPHPKAEDRLRVLFRVVQTLRLRETEDVAAAWMRGANPLLKGETPADLLHQDQPAKDAAVLSAAEDFVEL